MAEYRSLDVKKRKVQHLRAHPSERIYAIVAHVFAYVATDGKIVYRKVTAPGSSKSHRKKPVFIDAGI